MKTNGDYIVQDAYSGMPLEPDEDQSIIQPDGSRACFNWECAEGFYVVDLEKDHSKVGLIDDGASLFLESSRK